MGDENMSQRCLKQWKETVDFINAKFWDEARGAFVDYITLDDQRAKHISEHGNYMMMTYGYVSPERAARIAQFLRDPGVEIGQVSPLQMDFLMNGLFNYG